MTPTPPIETIHEDTELRLRWVPGSGNRLVVVFTGRHHTFGDQPADEFATSAHDGGANNVLFVSDLMQSWYSRPGLWPRIVRLVRGIAEIEGQGSVVTLGNSMGGFGALLLPRDMPVVRAIGFSAQVSMVQRVIRDRRWPNARRRLGRSPVINIRNTVARTKTHYYLTAGRGAPLDMAHMALMPRNARVRRWALPGAGHNIAKKLKESGVLMPAIHAMIDGDTATVETLYKSFQARQGPDPVIGAEGETVT